MEADLSAAYTAFVHSVLALCTGSETGGIHAFLVLNHTRIELECLKKKGEDIQKGNPAGEYLDRALDFLQCIFKGLRIEIPAHSSPSTILLPPPKRLDIRWTGNVVELTELIMAIQETKCINDGKLCTIELFNYLCDVLGLDRAACFSHYTNMKNRRNPTKFLDRLKYVLLRKIASDDEKPPLLPRHSSQVSTAKAR
jgi:hypothetical protein